MRENLPTRENNNEMAYTEPWAEDERLHNSVLDIFFSFAPFYFGRSV